MNDGVVQKKNNDRLMYALDRSGQENDIFFLQNARK